MLLNSNRFTCLLWAACAFGAPAQEQGLQSSRALMQRRHFAEAQPALEAYVNEHPDSADGRYLLGFLYYSLHDAQHSLDQYKAAKGLREPKPEDLMAIAADYVLLGQFAEAAKWLTQMTEEQPQNKLAWYYLGRARYSNSQYDEAAKAFTQALVLSPRDVAAETNLGLVYEAEEQDMQAMECYSNALDWQKGSLAQSQEPYLFKAALLNKKGQSEEALSLLKDAKSYGRENPAVHEESARAYEALGRHKEAQSEAEQAVAMVPDAIAFHVLLGKIDRAQGMMEAAKEQMAIAARLKAQQAASAPE